MGLVSELSRRYFGTVGSGMGSAAGKSEKRSLFQDKEAGCTLGTMMKPGNRKVRSLEDLQTSLLGSWQMTAISKTVNEEEVSPRVIRGCQALWIMAHLGEVRYLEARLPHLVGLGFFHFFLSVFKK